MLIKVGNWNKLAKLPDNHFRTANIKSWKNVQ